MARISICVGVTIICLTAINVPAGLHAQTATIAGVSLKISNEIVPPGGMAQAKVFITEPKPISTARASFSLDGYSTIEGIALRSPERDTLGVAVVRGSELTLSVLSPSATFGMELNPDYPVLMIAGRVAATTPIGTAFTLDMNDASLQFTDASGALYPAETQAGSLLVARNVGIDDVVPGSANVAGGGVVTVIGRGFNRDTKVKLKEVALSGTTYADPSHMQVTLAQPTRMHGVGVRVVNRDGAEAKYFSYQRTVRQRSSLNFALNSAIPVFPDVDVTSALIDVTGYATGLAIQNRQAVPVDAAAELLDAEGHQLAGIVVNVGAGQFLLQDLSELFGTPYSSSQVVRVRSLSPIQIMGVAVDAAGDLTPLPIR